MKREPEIIKLFKANVPMHRIVYYSSYNRNQIYNRIDKYLFKEKCKDNIIEKALCK